MPVLIDTDVAIHWRDGDPEIRQRIAALGELPALSAISWVEVENGVYSEPKETAVRRARWDVMRRTLQIFDFTLAEAEVYGEILTQVEAAKRKTNDRMIAATALANDLVLVTINGRDYRDIPDLKLEVWPAPTPPPS